MVRGIAMDSQDKRTCKAESTFSGTTIDYNHQSYDEDCFGDILNLFDFPMESLEGDALAEDWASKLGPIPSDFFRELFPPVVSQTGGGSATDIAFEYPILNGTTSQLKPHPNSPEERKPDPLDAPSPNSVLESRTSSSNNKNISFGVEITIPVRTRTKRTRPTTTQWRLPPPAAPNTANKRRQKPSPAPATTQTKILSATGIKKCAHCEITKTPQWREGPMGPRTLCNACGVRYRSGRLYPEYRPAASPTFVPSLHSNSHRKVIEMRQKGVK